MPKIKILIVVSISLRGCSNKKDVIIANKHNLLLNNSNSPCPSYS